jgi:putative transposase
MAHRYRMYPGEGAERVMRDLHCAHARYVWNLAVEQQSWWRPTRGAAPGSAERQRQLAQARQAEPWLREGSSSVQQQALRDYDKALAAFFDPQNPAGKPGYRSKRQPQGFVIRDVRARRVSRKWGEVLVPKCGWVRFRWSRPLPEQPGMARVTLDRAARWHIAFPGAQPAVARNPEPEPRLHHYTPTSGSRRKHSPEPPRQTPSPDATSPRTSSSRSSKASDYADLPADDQAATRDSGREVGITPRSA